MTLNQFIGNLTLLALSMIFLTVLIKALRSHTKSWETIVDGATLIGVSGWIIQIMSAKVYHASFPALIFLIVILVQLIRCKGSVINLYENKSNVHVQSKKLKNH